MNYSINCYDNKDRLVYNIDVWLMEEEFDEQIKNGYLRFRDKDNLDTICYLNIYTKLVITKYI